MSFVIAAAEAVARHAHQGMLIVLESTTYPGTTRDVMQPRLEKLGLVTGQDVFLAFSPERVDPGNPTWHTKNTPKVLGGITPACTEAAAALYGTCIDRIVRVSSPEAAELTKLLENTFRSVNIGLVNEMAIICDRLGVDVWEVIEAAATKPFGFMKFTPGPGVGGHCLPVDPSYLSWKVRQALGLSFRFVELANDVNDHMPDYVARRITALLNNERKAVNGSRILVLGLAYKRNSGDARESPGPVLCDRLTALGAEVRAVDPHLADGQFPPTVVRAELSIEELGAADVVVVVTDHDTFDWDAVLEHAPRIFDARHRLPPSPNVEHI
jgi:UDP-N-acetyl-D-glucosamine dehydrogenase